MFLKKIIVLKVLLDLKNYDNLVKAYEEYLELQNNNNNPQDPTTPGEDGLSTGEVILIVCGSLLGVCVIAFGAFFVIKYLKKGKGGKENEENNLFSYGNDTGVKYMSAV